MFNFYVAKSTIQLMELIELLELILYNWHDLFFYTKILLKTFIPYTWVRRELHRPRIMKGPFYVKLGSLPLPYKNLALPLYSCSSEICKGIIKLSRNVSGFNRVENSHSVLDLIMFFLFIKNEENMIFF